MSAMNLMIVHGILVCSSFLIIVCIFIVSKALLTSSATVIVRAGGALGGGMSAVYILICVGERMPPCGMPVLN